MPMDKDKIYLSGQHHPRSQHNKLTFDTLEMESQGFLGGTGVLKTKETIASMCETTEY